MPPEDIPRAFKEFFGRVVPDFSTVFALRAKFTPGAPDAQNKKQKKQKDEEAKQAQDEDDTENQQVRE